jgi:Mg-chelatase subunit ChlD
MNNLQHSIEFEEGSDGPLAMRAFLEYPEGITKKLCSSQLVALKTYCRKSTNGTASIPHDFIFLIDISGSMKASGKLAQVQGTLKYFVLHLPKDSRMAVITFHSEAELLTKGIADDGEVNGLVPMNQPTNQNQILEKIQQMTPQGSTNFEASWDLAFQVLNQRQTRSPATIIFFTDGLANVGKLGKELLQHLTNLRRNVVSNLTMNCLGFGVDHDSFLLTSVAKLCGGMYYYVESPNMIASCFVDCVETALSLSALNVTLDLQAFKGCRIVGHLAASKVETVEKFKKLRINIGNLAAGQSHILIIKLSLNVADDMKQDLLKATLSYDSPSQFHGTTELLLTTPRTESSTLPSEHAVMPIKISKSFFRLSAAEWIESAIKTIQIGGPGCYERARQTISDGIQELYKHAPDLAETNEGKQILFGLNEVLKGVEDPQMFQAGCHYAMAYAAVFASGRSSGVQELMGMSKIAQTLGQNHLARETRKVLPPPVEYLHHEEIQKAKQEIARYVEGYLLLN